MDRIRVLIIDMPPLLSDIVVETIARQPDMELAGAVTTVVGLRRAMRRGQTDVVVCRLHPGALPAAYRELFDLHGRLRLIVIHADDRRGSTYDLKPDRSPLDVCPQGLVAAIRSAGTARASQWDALVEQP